LSEINKKDLSELDICDQYITPSVKEAGWDQLSQIRRDVTLTPGPIIVRGNMSARNRKRRNMQTMFFTGSLEFLLQSSKQKITNTVLAMGCNKHLGIASY